MRYLSVCSGIEAATMAWHPLGWKPVGFSEIEAFPSSVLAHHYPQVPNFGDMTKFKEWKHDAIDLLVGGTPCQSFSVAGLRKGMADPRGNLALTYLAIAEHNRPRWIVWENVPGVLSSNGGRDFGSFLGGLGQLGYGFAYRVLDAQFVRTCGKPFAVPQRRRRVFVVGYLGDWRRAAAVLFDRESLSGHPAPRREAGQGSARGIEIGPSGGGFADVNPTLDTRCKDGPVRNQLAGAVMHCAEVSSTLNAAFGSKLGLEDQHINSGAPLFVSVAHSLRGEGFDASEDGTGRGTPSVPVSYSIQERAVSENPESGPQGKGWQEGIGYTIEARNKVQAVAFAQNERDELRLIGGDGASVGALAAQPGMKQQAFIATPWAVRRLTPIECERLQGFPDGFTQAPHRNKPAADGPRYKALGNSMAVNVMAYIGERIQLVEDMQ